MFKIFPYKNGSQSVAALKTALGALVIKREGSRYRYKSTDVVINWGSSVEPSVLSDVAVLNDFDAVAVAANKLDTLRLLQDEDVPTVDFTTNKEEAEAWGTKVFVRQDLTGHSGAGIQVVEPILVAGEVDDFTQDVGDILEELADSADTAGQRHLVSALTAAYVDVASEPEMTTSITLPDAPLYTKAVRNNGEYRVHVMNGEVILYQKKSRRVDEETGDVITADGADADVRNLASNWIYRTGNLNRLERVEALAIQAIDALGLDFGAVDIIMDEDGSVYTLEVNTAPGISNQATAEAYINGFRSLVE